MRLIGFVPLLASLINIPGVMNGNLLSAGSMGFCIGVGIVMIVAGD